MSYAGTALDLSNEVVFRDPNQGGVVADYTPTGGRVQRVRLLDVPVDEEQVFGDVRVRTEALYKMLRVSEVSIRPQQDSEVLIDGGVWLIKSAEPDPENLNWKLDLRKKRG